MEQSRKLLIVEDDFSIQELLSTNLRKGGWQVTMAESGEAALAAISDLNPDLILLDVRLPGLNGLQVCQQVRNNPKTSLIPIIMVSAAVTDAEIVSALEMGADDFIRKPFNLDMLRARIQAVIRRSSEPREQPQQKCIEIHGIQIDSSHHTVRVNGNPIQLTRADFEVLFLLASEPGRVYSRREIIDAGHGEEGNTIADRSVDVQIVSLRRKTGKIGRYIETVRGVGYRLKEA